jgi:hypothetical protein
LWRNLFDPEFGLFVFCPLLLAAAAYPWTGSDRTRLRPREAWFLVAAVVALYLFSSANQFALLQWNTGVRYMVPAGTLLFFLAVPVLRRLPQIAFWGLVVLTVTISWCVSMTRFGVPRAVSQVFATGLELPVLTVLRKTASGYWPELADGVSPIPAFLLVGVVLWLLWRDSPIVRAHHEK